MTKLAAASLDSQTRFIEQMDKLFKVYGVAGGMPERLKQAVRDTPRERFVHRFRVYGDPNLYDFNATPLDLFSRVYRDEPLIPVDAAGKKLPSTNSQPSYILWLLHLLDLEPGHHALEIGSGSGWLVAVMARLVHPAAWSPDAGRPGARRQDETRHGCVTGVEIIPSLVEQSRADLAALGVGDVTIIEADATLSPPPGAPFDRIIVTAATWALPVWLFDGVKDGGKILVPISMRAQVGCQVTTLRRDGRRLKAEYSVPGFFVPLVGSGQTAEANPPVDAFSVWPQLGSLGTGAFDLELVRAEDAPPPGEGVFVERRGAVALVWRLCSNAAAWRELLAD
jgi:protein-L-isoaspartate(D-aspartate) O-methyltransferase